MLDRIPRLCNLDEWLPAFEGRNDRRQFGGEATEQFGPTRVPHSNPHDCRTFVQESVDGEVFILRDDHRTDLGGVDTNRAVARGCTP